MLECGAMLNKVINFFQELYQAVECHQSEKDQREVAQKSIQDITIKNRHFSELVSAAGSGFGQARRPEG